MTSFQEKTYPLTERVAVNEADGQRSQNRLLASPRKKSMERNLSVKKIVPTQQSLTNIKVSNHSEKSLDENNLRGSSVCGRESSENRWREEKFSLYKELNDKSDRIRELEARIA